MFAQTSFAQETLLTQQVAAQPKWKTTFSSYYYNFDGSRASNRADYSFGATTLNIQLMGLQYQFENGWTAMLMVPYMQNWVSTKFFGTWYHDTTSGVGDTVLAVVKPIMTKGSFMLITDLGLSVPTGSIDEKNVNDPTRKTHYAYNMQMGSGTFDGVFGATALYLQPSYQLGSHLGTTLRTGTLNDNGYRLGNQYKLDVWVDRPLQYGLTPRVVGYYRYKDAIGGRDNTFGRNQLVEFYHHSQINWDMSAALKYDYHLAPKVALNAEAGIPFAQDSQNYDNVVVSTQYYLNLGVAGVF